MTRKEYKAIAKVIHDVIDKNVRKNCRMDGSQAIGLIISGLCKVFATDNPRFDDIRFITDCDIGEDET